MMANEERSVTQERLRELCKYDADSGNLLWRFTGRGCFAGRVMGSVQPRDGSRKAMIDGEFYYVAYLVYLYHYGGLPNRQLIYLDHDRSNTRIENLEESKNLKLPRRLTLEKARELLDYDPNTGKLRWKLNHLRGIRKGNVVEQKDGYINIATRSYPIDKLVHLMKKGEWPLRTRHRRDNKSGVAGVSYVSRVKKWQAHITVNKRQKSLGLFSDKKSAIKARKEAEKRYGYI